MRHFCDDKMTSNFAFWRLSNRPKKLAVKRLDKGEGDKCDCGLDDAKVAALAASPDAQPAEDEYRRVFDDLRKELAFLLGMFHSASNHRQDVMRCGECPETVNTVLKQASELAVRQWHQQNSGKE